MSTRKYKGRHTHRNAGPIVIVQGTIHDAVALQHIHYLPHLPACPLYICRALNQDTGTNVGICIIAYPCLASHQRTQVFGNVPTQILNHSFAQLARIIVHPCYSGKGLAKAMLKHCMKAVQRPVIEAINRSTVPSQLFKECGMTLLKGKDRNYYYKIKTRGNSEKTRRGAIRRKMRQY